jgi:hypothetical protein
MIVKQNHEWKMREYPLDLASASGYFLSMGFTDGAWLADAIQLLVDDPRLVETWMNVCAGLHSLINQKNLAMTVMRSFSANLSVEPASDF